MNDISLSNSQGRFLNMPNKFKAFVGGFGSGKTFAGCLDLSTFSLKHPRITQGYFAPTYPLINDIFYPTIDEAWNLIGESDNRRFKTIQRVGDKEVDLYAGNTYYGTII